MIRKYVAYCRAHLPECLVVGIVVAWTACMMVLGYLRYHAFVYDALDLSIYTQVMWSTVHGQWFAYTFNNYSYLADHREWILLVLVPVFVVWQHPLTLVALQILALAASAYPLFRITQIVWHSVAYRKWVGVCAVVVVLCHPAIQSMALYEFHALTLAVPVALMIWLSVLEHRFMRMWVWVIVALLIREDVGLMTAGVGVLILFVNHGRARMHGVALIAVSGVYSVGMILLGGYFFPSGSEKFLIFYPQLGSSVQIALSTMLVHPLQAFAPLFQYDHVWVVVVLCTSVAGLCLLAPLFLLPALAPFLLFLLIPKPMLSSVLGTHYSALIIPWVIIAAVYGGLRIARLRSDRARMSIATIMGVVIVLHMVSISGALYTVADISTASADTAIDDMWSALSNVGATENVVVSHGFATPLALRSAVYPALQVFRGKDHYAETPYRLPDAVDWVILRPRDMIEMTLNFPFTDISGGWQRIEHIITQNNLHVVVRNPDIMMWGRGEASADNREIITPHRTQTFSQTGLADVTLHSCEQEKEALVTCVFSRTAGESSLGDVHMVVHWYNDLGGVIAHQWVPLVSDTLMPSHAWTQDEDYAVTFPLRALDASKITFTLLSLSQQSEKVFLDRSTLQLSEFPHATVDVTALLLDEESGK